MPTSNLSGYAKFKLWKSFKRNKIREDRRSLEREVSPKRCSPDEQSSRRPRPKVGEERSSGWLKALPICSKDRHSLITKVLCDHAMPPSKRTFVQRPQVFFLKTSLFWHFILFKKRNHKEPCEVRISCTVLKSKNVRFLRLTTRLLTD